MMNKFREEEYLLYCIKRLNMIPEKILQNGQYVSVSKTRILNQKKQFMKYIILNASPEMLHKVWIPKLMHRQINQEARHSFSVEKNNIGLSIFDSKFVTSVYKDSKQRPLTEKQLVQLKRTLSKYWKQYINILQEETK